MFIKAIVKFIMALNSNTRAGFVAAGVACGFLLALVPAGNLLWVALAILIAFTKANSAMFIVVALVLKPFMGLLSGPLDALGYAVLTLPPLQGLFTAMADAPIVPYTRFNNTIVMGGFVAGVALWLPVFAGARVLVGLYRKKLAPKIAESKFAKAFMKMPLVQALTAAFDKAARIKGALE